MTSDVTISLSQTVWLVGSLMALGAFVAWCMKPFKKLENHETRITTLEKAQDEQRQTNQLMLQMQNAMLNHMIDGNGQDELKKARDAYQKEIISQHN